MSRKSSAPLDAVERALHTAETTQSANELRRALAVTLPALHGLPLKKTASLLGRSVTWIAKERRTFINEPTDLETKVGRGGRRNQLIAADEEDAFVEAICERYIRMNAEWRSPFLRSKLSYEEATQPFVEFAHAELERHIQRKTTRTSVYNLLSRTGKRIFPIYKPYRWKYKCEEEVIKRLNRCRELPSEQRTPERIVSVINNV